VHVEQPGIAVFEHDPGIAGNALSAVQAGPMPFAVPFLSVPFSVVGLVAESPAVVPVFSFRPQRPSNPVPEVSS
jgi:hypothetical protein